MSGLVVQFSGRRAFPSELIRSRRVMEGQTELLIRWTLLSAAEGGGSLEDSVLMWMSEEDALSSCPDLGLRQTAEDQSESNSEQSQDQRDLEDLQEDVRTLVSRAQRQIKTMCRSTPLSHTVSVLSSYAGIATLAPVFRETGALDLILELLCDPDQTTRRSAGSILRALASHDAGSRASVLLALAHRDLELDFENRCTLLELFAETTSSEEHICFENTRLPEIPGKALFSLVKQYLRVTSLLDSPLDPDPAPSASSGPSPWLRREFEVAMAMAALISELVQVLGWDRTWVSGHTPEPPRITRKSIFQPPYMDNQSWGSTAGIIQSQSSASSTHREFMLPEDFMTRTEYESYVQEHLIPGMRVEMNQDYEEVSSGDQGEFLQSNNGSPPVQVYWDSLGRTYWVDWRMLTIIGFNSNKTKDQTKPDQSESRLTQALTLTKELPKPCGGLYTCPYLSTGEVQGAELSTGEWWELLYFIKRLDPVHRDQVRTILGSQAGLDDCALIGLSVPVTVAMQLLHFLKKNLSSPRVTELQTTHCFNKLSTESEKHTDALTGPDPGPGSETCVESVSKKPKTESITDFEELPLEVKQYMTVFEERTHGKRSALETLEAAVEVLQKEREMRGSGADHGLQRAAVVFMIRTLDRNSADKNRNDSNIRSKVLKLLVDLLSGSSEVLVCSCLRLVHALLLKFDWRLSFCTEGGVRGVLSAMNQFKSSAVVQRGGLQLLQVVTGAGGSSSLPEGGAQLVREVFASITSATTEGTRDLLASIPAAITLMLQISSQDRTGLDLVQSGLLVLAWLLSHRGLKEALESCEVEPVLRQCVSEDIHSALALSVLRTISTDCDMDLQDSQIRTLVLGLKEPGSKEVIQTLEKVLCEAGPQEGAARVQQVTHSPDALLELFSLMGTHKSDQTVLLALLRILGKVLQCCDEVLPWHNVIEPCLSVINLHLQNKEFLQVSVGLLQRLACLDKDYAVLMVQLGSGLMLDRVLEKHSSLQSALELKDLTKDLEKYSTLYKSLASSLLAGCIQLVLGQIEELRRSHHSIKVPFFDVFLRNLCHGSSEDLHKVQCWEKVEVSSNSHRAKNLTDHNPKTYWESNGNSGSHYINIHLLRGVLVRELAVLLSPNDSSYMPSRILVFGQDQSGANTQLNAVNIAPSASRVVVLQKQTQFWPVIQIRIKTCQQGGIDARVHGFELLGPKPSFWPVFKDQLCLRTHLFYSSKANTWSQQVQADRSNLLSLYDRLYRVLKLEQSFSDRFLLDSEAALALGHTVWDALVCPLVHNMTSSDSPALAWLLTQYVVNSSAFCRWKRRASIFNSRVRRLIHLLVHVYSGHSSDTEEVTESTSLLSSGTKERRTTERSSSISDMALCWQGVVQQQVQDFLKTHLVQGRGEEFSECYCGLYRSLLRATSELFHQLSAFSLALRGGFSSALLQLSVGEGLTVSERFARHISHMISQVSSPGREGAESQLQMFLEVTLFLSGLELASTFEHFYRQYLGERLLLIGALWLESAVIGRIGACFPGRLPQQMIMNLTESEDLGRDFRLHRLQVLDQGLDEGLDPDLDQDLELDLDLDKVQVLVLSPRCWSVSSQFYLNQSPLQILPQTILNHLQQYHNFYQHYQRVSSPIQSSPRRLQWTALGRAQVRFGSWTLEVSTVQMLVLLQFNHHQELTLASLLDRTGLSEPILLHALQPLTSANGPLTYSQPDQTVMRVDPQVALRSQTNPVHVRLVPDQDYRSVHENSAAILERKRNFLLCTIVRIIKQERELHLDHLVFKVLDFCQKQTTVSLSSGSCPSPGPGSSSGPGLVRFSCSSSDVLSCVMHLFSKNCIRRKQEQPQILQYIPDSDLDLVQDYSHRPKTSLVLEDINLDSGRTMTQDEIREMMKKTVQQVSGTLSIDQDSAEHLLVLNLWNMDRVVERFTKDSEALLLEAGLVVPNPAPCGSDDSPSSCPVCLNPGSEKTPTLSCGHYCCQSCWAEYLTSRIEQNLVLTCNCPITDCTAQPTSAFYQQILNQDLLSKLGASLLRSYVDSCSNLTWCTNPSGCDRILLKQDLGNAGTCSECHWSSCFNCHFPEAHFPCSCGHMTRWVDDGGYYEGMSVEAQSKHLAKLISKRCPHCHTAIEKNEGCLHMTCAKCSHGFCWRCLKPWKPNHKDFYNCSASVSRAARQNKIFQDFNEKCTFHHQAKTFALDLVRRLSSLSDSVPMISLNFVLESCRVLIQSRKVLAYSCVFSYYSQAQMQEQGPEQLDLMEQQNEALELHTTALQVLLEEALQVSDLESSLRWIKPELVSAGLELVRRVQDRLKAILHHSTQDFRVGCDSRSQSESLQVSEQTNHSEANKELKSDSDQDQDEDYDEDEDEEYVPEWNEDDLDEEYYSDYDQDHSPFD